MMLKWYFIGLIFLVAGCAALKNSSVHQIENNSNRMEKKVSEKDSGTTIIEKDSTRLICAPVEQSRNESTDSSYLYTSLAWSSAVWRDGRLRHTIGNFPTIEVPIKTIYQDRWNHTTDTVIIRDTIFRQVYVNVEKVIEPSWWDRMWIGLGKILFLALLVWIAWRKLR